MVLFKKTVFFCFLHCLFPLGLFPHVHFSVSCWKLCLTPGILGYPFVLNTWCQKANYKLCGPEESYLPGGSHPWGIG